MTPRNETETGSTDRQTDPARRRFLPPYYPRTMQRNFPTLPRTADLSRRRCNINDPHPVTAVCCLEWQHVLRNSEGENGRRRGLQTRLALMRFSFELRGGKEMGEQPEAEQD